MLRSVYKRLFALYISISCFLCQIYLRQSRTIVGAFHEAPAKLLSVGFSFPRSSSKYRSFLLRRSVYKGLFALYIKISQFFRVSVLCDCDVYVAEVCVDCANTACGVVCRHIDVTEVTLCNKLLAREQTAFDVAK